MQYLFLFTLWEICLAGAFVGGYILGKKNKGATPRPKISEEEQRQSEKRQKELENFMTYNGMPQNDING